VDEYSYPEQKEHVEDQEDEDESYSSDQPMNVTEEKDCNSTSTAADFDEEPSVLKDDVMLLDSRLEWMEASMAEMIKNYNKLKKKVSLLCHVCWSRIHCVPPLELACKMIDYKVPF